MVLSGCAFDMMLQWFSAIIFLELMALSPGFGAPGASKMTISTLNMQMFLIVALIFLFMLFLVHFCYALKMMLLCLSANQAHGPTTRFRGPLGPLK